MLLNVLAVGLPVNAGFPLSVGFPLNVGFPVYVPAREPPPDSELGPELVTPALRVSRLENVLLPVNMLLAVSVTGLG